MFTNFLHNINNSQDLNQHFETHFPQEECKEHIILIWLHLIAPISGQLDYGRDSRELAGLVADAISRDLSKKISPSFLKHLRYMTR